MDSHLKRLLELNNNFYSGAVIRVATLQKRGRPGTLIFSTVSLIPRGRPLPPSMKGAHRIHIGKTGETVFFRRVLLSIEDALAWYQSLGRGGDKTPIPSKQEERDNKLDGIEFKVSKLTDDPSWPYLGLPIGEGVFAHPSEHSHPAPFAGSAPVRIHRRFGSQDGFDLILRDDKAIAFLARRLHVDLRLYQEYLGSLALIAPDPVLKQIDNFMIPASADKEERIFYRLVPRAGQSLTGLKLTTFDQQARLLTDFSTHEIPADGILDIEKGDCIGTYGYVVSHEQHGVLAYSPPTSFLRQINLSMYLGKRDGMKVSVPTGESANSPHMEYPVAQNSQLASQSLIGDGTRIPNVNARIANAVTLREKNANAKKYGQRWFSDGSREEAMRFIQGELRRAKSRVIVADPYLGGLQLGQFLYAVNPETVSVTLLSSGLAFKTNKQEPSKIDDFSQRLAQLKKDANVTTKAYVLQSPILHDRFLAIDNTVWFLGNSLNTLGEKASLIVKIPNPDEVIDQLEVMLNKAIPFEDYKKLKTGNSM